MTAAAAKQRFGEVQQRTAPGPAPPAVLWLESGMSGHPAKFWHQSSDSNPYPNLTAFRSPTGAT